MKQLFKNVFVGILALIPLFIVIQIIIWVNSLMIKLFKFVSLYTDNALYTVLILFLVFVFLAAVGASIQKAGKSFIVSTIDNILENVPAIGTIYGIIKKLTELFKPNSDDHKQEVVLVEYPRKGLWVPSYVLSKHNDTLVLFVPTSPNPTSGYTVIVHKDEVVQTSLTVAEASQFIVSMGADFVKKDEISKIIEQKVKNDR